MNEYDHDEIELEPGHVLHKTVLPFRTEWAVVDEDYGPVSLSALAHSLGYSSSLLYSRARKIFAGKCRPDLLLAPKHDTGRPSLNSVLVAERTAEEKAALANDIRAIKPSRPRRALRLPRVAHQTLTPFGWYYDF